MHNALYDLLLNLVSILYRPYETKSDQVDRQRGNGFGGAEFRHRLLQVHAEWGIIEQVEAGRAPHFTGYREKQPVSTQREQYQGWRIEHLPYLQVNFEWEKQGKEAGLRCPHALG